MLLLPTILLALSGIGGAGGLALSVKSFVDSTQASATNRYVQEQNERNILRFEACSNQLDQALNKLGKQRMTIAKNFNVFVNSFEKIHNHPEFSQSRDVDFPDFDFDEIKNVSTIANVFVGSAAGAAVGSVMGAAAASGMTSAMIALGKASTGTPIASLSGIAQTKSALAALGGGAISANGGGIALGTIVLNAATLGVALLVEGIALSFSGSLAKKEADKARHKLQDNEKIISDAIQMQLDVHLLCDRMNAASVSICNGIYKELVFKLKALVEVKTDWNTFSDEEKRLVENCILVVQVLHYLNNIALYKVNKYNEDGEIEEAEPNIEEVNSAIRKANRKVQEVRNHG